MTPHGAGRRRRGLDRRRPAADPGGRGLLGAHRRQRAHGAGRGGAGRRPRGDRRSHAARRRRSRAHARAQDARSPPCEVIVITAYGSVRKAMEATKGAGAFHVLEKPFEPDEVLALVKNALEHRKLVVENTELRRRLVEQTADSEILGSRARHPAGDGDDHLGGRHRRQRPDHRRERHRQGADRQRAARAQRAGATGRGSRSTARRCPRTSSSPSCSATPRARSPAPPPRRSACWRRPTRARCCSTRSRRCRSTCRPSCSACSRSAWCGAWAAPSRSPSTSGCSPPPTATPSRR